MSNEEIKLEGNIENIIFSNPENGYTVFSVSTENCEKTETNEEIVCVGYIPNINQGENIKLTGSFVIHPTYGKQLNVQVYEKTVPKTEEGIEKYLASGVIKGIGKVLAKKIIDEFGLKTLDIMEKTPEKLSIIRGISLEKALNFGTIFHEQGELRKAIIFLQDYGVSPVYAMKIYKKYKDNTLNVINTNPYRLADEIFGIGFKIADNIAEKVGISKDSMFRIKAGIKYSLNKSAQNGNIYLPIEEFLDITSNLLDIQRGLIENTILPIHLEHEIYAEKFEGETNIYLNSYYYAENYVAKKIFELSETVIASNYDYNKEIDELEKLNNIELAKKQRLAVIEAMSNGLLVITGGPGTGKTTTINSIINLLQNEGYEIQLAAPTGRAAKRMTEATGIEAQTIHRLLGITYISEDNKKQKFEKNEDNPIEADVIIIDESSMVDIVLMNSLLKAVPQGSRIILVGDVDQLPSVGPGNVLKDIIGSNCVKVVRLNEIFRQAQESAIIMNAHRINNGEYPILNEKNKDFFFIKRYDVNELINTILELVTTRLPNYMNCNGIKDIQILTPMRKSPLGVLNLNSVLQSKLNPPNSMKNEKEFRNIIFREGDKVMQIKNNYNLIWKSYKNNIQIDEGTGVFNGDEGIIKKINSEYEYIEIAFDDNRIVIYDYSQLDELELSYAVTIHKSQGSEYKVVVIPVHSGPDMLLNRNLLYTAITRAKELAVIVGIPETLFKMVDNNKEINRYTSLKKRIVDIYDFMKA